MKRINFIERMKKGIITRIEEIQDDYFYLLCERRVKGREIKSNEITERKLVSSGGYGSIQGEDHFFPKNFFRPAFF